MNHSEIRELFEKKIRDALDSIKKAKNGDMLSIRTSFSYVDDKLIEKQEYNGRDNTSLVASITAFTKERDSDEDPSYTISLLCDLKNGLAKNPAELEEELKSFDNELARFLTELSSCDDLLDFITREDEKITLEGEKMVAKLEASLKKMKKAGIIGGIVLLGIILLLRLL